MKHLIPLIAVFLLAGCATGPSPDLVVFEKGLYPLDSALYTQHTQLMNDAVKNGLRTPADQTVVSTEINAAQSLHSKAMTTHPAP